jgi:hypothetical protein
LKQDMIAPPDSYEPDCEDIAWEREKETELESFRSEHGDIIQAIRASSKTDRQLRDASKEGKSIKRELWERYQFDVGTDSFEVSLDGENYFTVPRNGVAHTLTRKDKKRMKKNLRKRGRRLGILTKRGCSPRQVRGYEGGSFTAVVAAT